MYSVISRSCTISRCKGSKYSHKFKTLEDSDDKYKNNSGNCNKDNTGFKETKDRDSNSKDGEYHTPYNPRVRIRKDQCRGEDSSGNSLKEYLAEGSGTHLTQEFDENALKKIANNIFNINLLHSDRL